MTTEPLRNLVVCVDGTANKFSDKNTNVIKLYDFLKKDELQRTYYSSGIGTSAYFKSKGMTDGLDQITGQNIAGVIIDAYRWLADIYQERDRIFLFGFSRGAYQVRALAAMIKSVGLIHAGNKKQIPFAWELYMTGKPDKQKYQGMVGEFKRIFSREVKIYFLGAWDTVSSVGLFRREQPLPLTHSREYIEHFRHALALDERRVKFLPEYALDKSWGKNTKDVWFIGSHSDIGGKKTKEQEEYAAEALIWMMDEAKQVGLRLNCQDVHACIPVPTVPKGLRGWWIVEYLPMTWVSFDISGTPEFAWGIHRGQSRRMLPEHKLHWTVFAGIELSKSQSRYQPRAILDVPINSSLTLEQLTSKDDWSSYKDRCEGHDPLTKYNILKLLRDINNAHLQTIPTQSSVPRTNVAQSFDKEPPNQGRKSDIDRVVNNLEKLFTFVCEGQADIVWIYGGPKFLLRLILISGHYDEDRISERCRDVIYRVVDPRRSPPRESDLKQTTNLDSRLADSYVVDDIVFPRLCGVLRHCQKVLEQGNTSRPEADPDRIPYRSGTPGWMAEKLWQGAGALKEGVKTLKDGVDKLACCSGINAAESHDFQAMKIAAAKLSYLSSIITPDVLNASRKSSSLSVTEFPYLILLPPQSDATSALHEWTRSAFEASIQVISKLIEDDCLRPALHAVAIIEKLVHWIDYYKSTTRTSSTPEIVTNLGINIIKQCATDPAAASFPVYKYKDFVLQMMGALIHNKDQLDKNMQGLQELLTVANYAASHSLLEDDGQTGVIHDWIEWMISLIKKATGARNILIMINLARYDGPRKQMLAQNILGALISMMESSDVTDEKACASIGLIVELARHDDSRGALIDHRHATMGSLANLLENELTHSQASKEQMNDKRRMPPIAKQFFAYLPVFILNTISKLKSAYEAEDADEQRYLMVVDEVVLRAKADDDYNDVMEILVQGLTEDVRDANSHPGLARVSRETERLRVINHFLPLVSQTPRIHAKEMLSLSVGITNRIEDPLVRNMAPVVGRTLGLIRQLVGVSQLIKEDYRKEWGAIDTWVIRLRGAKAPYINTAYRRLLPSLRSTTEPIVKGLVTWPEEPKSSASGSG